MVDYSSSFKKPSCKKLYQTFSSIVGLASLPPNSNSVLCPLSYCRETISHLQPYFKRGAEVKAEIWQFLFIRLLLSEQVDSPMVASTLVNLSKHDSIMDQICDWHQASRWDLSMLPYSNSLKREYSMYYTIFICILLGGSNSTLSRLFSPRSTRISVYITCTRKSTKGLMLQALPLMSSTKRFNAQRQAKSVQRIDIFPGSLI